MSRLKQLELLPESYTPPEEALSIRQLTDAIENNQFSGSRRAAITEDVSDALWSLLVTSWAMYGERAAAVITLHICARDRMFEPPYWLREFWRMHRQHIGEFFHNPDKDRQTDWSSE